MKNIILVLLSALTLPSFANDNYTSKFTIVTDVRTDAKDFLSGPEHWVEVRPPVKETLPDTIPVTQMFTRRYDDNNVLVEHWESCHGSCGPGCGGGDELMGGCEVINGPANPVTHTWSKKEGGSVTCGYEVWSCKTHSKCQKHDDCLVRCKTLKPGDAGCKAACHAAAAGFCGTLGGWINGDPIDACWQKKLTYSRVIIGSCHDDVQ